MLVSPKMKVERSAQLEAGELFLFDFDGEKFLGFMCDYRDPNQLKLILPLGPKFTGHVDRPRLLNINVTAISFEKEFAIRLPLSPLAWSETQPPNDQLCLFAVGTTVYFRADGASSGSIFAGCYIDVATGVVETIPTPPPGRYQRPSGTGVYTTSWEIVTTEPEPRLIQKYPLAP
jgi:hypothetical protein